MIKFTQKGDFSRTQKFFERCKEIIHKGTLDKYGLEGVRLLRDNTPIDSGITADSWTYEIVHSNGRMSIVWKNASSNEGIPIAILIQYGHATRSGSYVQGRDFINPAIQPLFDRMAEELWREVRTF